ncbi:MAG: hypothetical protein WCL37_05800, partial [Chrysiogenales bacterium]
LYLQMYSILKIFNFTALNVKNQPALQCHHVWVKRILHPPAFRLADNLCCPQETDKLDPSG